MEKQENTFQPALTIPLVRNSINFAKVNNPVLNLRILQNCAYLYLQNNSP